tara:strand:+ start:320 stop:520 length:201 start_codon:yes stop_codon:yes gene_type:complete
LARVLGIIGEALRVTISWRNFFGDLALPLKETISLEVGRDLWAAVSYSKILAIFSRTTTSWPVPTK